MRRWPRLWVAGLLVLLSAGLCPVLAEAATGVGVSPGRFAVEVAAGQTAENTLKVSNEGDGPLHIRAYPMDRRLRAGGKVEFLPPGDSVDSPAAWLDVEPKEFSLSPGQEQEVRWKASVPTGAIPGDYVGVLFFETAPEARAGTVAIGSRVGALLSIRVVGEAVVAGRLVDFHLVPSRIRLRLAPLGRNLLSVNWVLPFPLVERGPASFAASFENTGNARLPITGEITVRDVFGRVVATLSPPEPVAVYPHDIDTIELLWKDVPIVGRFVATARFVLGKQEATSTVVLYAFPLKETISVILLGLGAWLLLATRARRKPKGVPPAGGLPPDGGLPHPQISPGPGGLPSRRERKQR